MNPIVVFCLTLALGVLPFALSDRVFNGLDLLVVLALITAVIVQVQPHRKAHK